MSDWRPWLACHNLPGWNTGKCCPSCHEDWESDKAIEMIEEYDNRGFLRWHLCCSAWEFWDFAWEGS